MFVPVPMLIAIGVAFALLLFIAFRRRDKGRDLVAPPPSMTVPSLHTAKSPPPLGVDLPVGVERELRRLAAEGRKIEAVKRVREVTGMNLQDAVEVVKRL